MTIGAALLLIAAGAILRFAITTSTTHGVDLHMIGDILIGVGALGLVLWMFVWAPWVRSRRSAHPQRPPLEDERPAPSAYREDRYPYRSEERYPYPSDERRYEDQYPR